MEQFTPIGNFMHMFAFSLKATEFSARFSNGSVLDTLGFFLIRVQSVA